MRASGALCKVGFEYENSLEKSWHDFVVRSSVTDGVWGKMAPQGHLTQPFFVHNTQAKQMNTQVSLVDAKTKSKYRFLSIVSDHHRRVSSVLNKNSKQFGKQNMFDGSDETCWNSHQVFMLWYDADD